MGLKLGTSGSLSIISCEQPVYMCVCVYNCVSVCQGLTLSSHIHLFNLPS